MNTVSEHSCWGVARWSVIAFLAAVALFYLFGGFHAAGVTAS